MGVYVDVEVVFCELFCDVCDVDVLIIGIDVVDYF